MMKFKKNPLTGILHLDVTILNKMEDRDLANYSASCRIARKFCNSEKNDDNLWMNRVMAKFPYVPIEIHKNYKGCKSWRNYYIHELSIFDKKNVNLNSKLICSSLNGKLHLVMIALEKGADIHYKDDLAVGWASKGGHLEIVKYLVEKGAGIYSKNCMSIEHASGNGHLEVAKYLVEKGAIISNWAVRWASENGHLEVVKFFTENGADIHAGYECALTSACSNGQLEVVKYLVEKGANIHVDNDRPILIASLDNHVSVVRYLVSKGADSNMICYRRNSLLIDIPDIDNVIE